MIEEVLSLGVKGDDLVLSQLQKIQEQKERFEKPANLSVSSMQGSAFAKAPLSPTKPGEKTTANKSQSSLNAILVAIVSQREYLARIAENTQKSESPGGQPKPGEPKPDSDPQKKKESDSMKEVTQAAKSAAQGLATLSSGNAIRGVAQGLRLIPFIGDSLADATVQSVNALEAFRANVESASKINYDTAESKSRISNIVQGSGGGNFTGRVDLDLNTQRGLAEALGEKFGVVQKPLQDSIKELFRSRDGKAVDVNQAAALAQGQFSALGTDKGFFLQKIQDQLGSLPPTMRQAITASLQQNVKKQEQFTETSADERGVVTKFDQAQRQRASDIMGETTTGSDGVRRSAADNALQIATVMNKLDGTLNTGFSKLLDGIRDAIGRVAPQGTGGGIAGRP